MLEQIEFQYGPDERAIKLRGDARLTFGAQPELDGVLSSPQIDLDRVLGAARGDAPPSRRCHQDIWPIFTGAQRMPIPSR